MLQESGSSLASIIGPYQEFLTCLQSSKLTSPIFLPFQWHAKFWGKSMEDEEQQWRDAQPPMSVEGGGLGGDEPMDVDTSEGEDLDDDFIKGCYSLEIGIKRLRIPKVWIRAEYIRIYNALEAYYQKRPSITNQAPAAVITGQPGIGKSVWIYYALRRRLAERKPVIWYLDQTLYLFVEEGVYKVPDELKASHFQVFVWTLVDSDETKEGVPNHLVTHETQHFVIYCTSPGKERWSRLHKTVRVRTVIMNPWKRKEILRVVSTLSPDAIRRVNDVFDQFGPIPRLCIDYLDLDSDSDSDPDSNVRIAQYKNDVQKAIASLKLSKLEQLIEDSSSLAMDEHSHKICLISREDRESVYSSAIVSPITSTIKSRLANHFQTLEHREQIRLYKHFSKVPDSRATAGIFFEAAGQRCLQHGVTLYLVPMVRLPPRKRDSQWHTSHVILRNATLERSRQQALEQGQSLVIPKDLQIQAYANDGPLSPITPNVIYVPELTNQVALDYFIFMNDLLYIFRFTIGKEHGIKPGLIDFVDKYPELPTMDNWRFVFIVPPEHELICPQPQSQTLQPYSAVINLDKCYMTS